MTSLDRDATQHDPVAEHLTRIQERATTPMSASCADYVRDTNALLGFARDVLAGAGTAEHLDIPIHPRAVRDAANRHLGGDTDE